MAAGSHAIDVELINLFSLCKIDYHLINEASLTLLFLTNEKSLKLTINYIPFQDGRTSYEGVAIFITEGGHTYCHLEEAIHEEICRICLNDLFRYYRLCAVRQDLRERDKVIIP